ncbi:MAG TPA: hypothetical protein VMF30_18495 [Pirellulales bacterium]|nr:hypothetical protein [Pirellulales bacterium]
MALCLAGCTKTDGLGRQETLSAEEAKTALVKLLEQTDDADLAMQLDALKAAQPVIADGGKLTTFGPLSCNLAERKFVLLVIAPNNVDFVEWAGGFDRQPGGNWVARVTERSSP